LGSLHSKHKIVKVLFDIHNLIIQYYNKSKVELEALPRESERDFLEFGMKSQEALPPVPEAEFIDPVFAKISPKRSFAKTGSINSGTG
jgi:hypothetical protein